MGVFSELNCLPQQQKLFQSKTINFIGQFSLRLRQSSRLPLDQILWPFKVIGAAKLGFERPKQRVVFEPALLGCTELV